MSGQGPNTPDQNENKHSDPRKNDDIEERIKIQRGIIILILGLILMSVGILKI